MTLPSTYTYLLSDDPPKGYWTYADLLAEGKRQWIDRPQCLTLTSRLRPGDTVNVPRTADLVRGFADLLTVTRDWCGRGVRLVLEDARWDSATEDALRLLEVLAEAAVVHRVPPLHGLRRQPPYGFRREGKGVDAPIVPDPEQRKVGARIVDLRHRGLEFAQVAAQLEAAGIKPPHTKHWNRAVARGIYTSERRLRAMEEE